MHRRGRRRRLDRRAPAGPARLRGHRVDRPGRRRGRRAAGDRRGRTSSTAPRSPRRRSGRCCRSAGPGRSTPSAAPRSPTSSPRCATAAPSRRAASPAATTCRRRSSRSCCAASRCTASTRSCAPPTRRAATWARLAEVLDTDALEAMTSEVTLDDAARAWPTRSSPAAPAAASSSDHRLIRLPRNADRPQTPERRRQTRRPRARLITRRWTSLVPSPISRILASR